VALSPHRACNGVIRAAAVSGLLAVSGCFAMVAGVHQDMEFKSDLPSVSINMDGQRCDVPCTLKIRRQWGTFQMQATQNGELVARGPISRTSSYVQHDCDSTRDNFGLMMVAAVTDGLLIIPGIVDISTGIVIWHPDTVVIEPNAYRLEDRCFEQPVVLKSEPPS